MSLDYLPDLRCLLMLDGTLFGNVPDAAGLAPMEMRLGEALTPFQLCTAPDVPRERQARYELNLRDIAQRTTSHPAERSAGEIYACWVDHLEDWSLSGHETLQVMIHRQEDPCTIDLCSPILLPRQGEGFAFHALLAAHRAEAELVLRLSDPVTMEEQTVRFAFDRSYPGGRQRAGYLAVRQALPPHFSACQIDLSIAYLGHSAPQEGSEPFLFLSDVSVRPSAASGATKLLEPAWLYGEQPEPNGQWITAPLPTALLPGQSLSVKLGAQTYPFLPMPRPEFRVLENYGHTLVCSSSTEMDLLLCIDGAAVEPLRVSPSDTVIRIPNRYLSGHVRHLSLKDRSGSVTIYERLQLMPAVLTPADVMQRESAAPFPAQIFAQTPLRYAGLKRILSEPRDQCESEQLTHALKTVEGGHENVVLRPLRFPEVAEPDVSIIIPAHNGIELTYLALCSLLIAPNDASFEVIVVDDGSSDETAKLEEMVQGITVVRNRLAQRFVRACNAGAEQARGTYIALLNNDTEVTTGWLDALVDAFDRFENVGLAGSKLLYPDGTLQEAGGIVWSSGNPWNYGNRENPNEPRFSYARQADYLSGAALMIRRDLWQTLGGLSSEMEPMYFEDTDLAFRVREAGYSTWYVPSSVVYHFEGMTSGTDTAEGCKRYQEINRPKFKRRWANALTGHGHEGRNTDMEKDRGVMGRVLFIDYAPPRPDKDAGSYATVQEMKLVQSLGYKVTFVSTNTAHLGRYTEDLQNVGIEVIYAPFYLNVSDYLDRHATDFDAFYIIRYYVAQAVLPQIRRLAPDAKVFFNNSDLHFLRELRSARHTTDEAGLDRARQTRTEELDVISAADVVLSYTEAEHSVIEAYTDGAAKVIKCPWVVEVPEADVSVESRQGISFLGGFRHYPNVEGMRWFARSVMPLLGAAAGSLTIYGSGMTEEVRDLAGDRVIARGYVEDLAAAFQSHRIFVAPLLSGAGIKGKVLAALSHGIPVVLSPIAAEGIGLRSGHDCLIAEDPREWCTAIECLTRDDAMWQDMSAAAQRYMREAYSFDAGRAAMRRAFEAADLYRTRP